MKTTKTTPEETARLVAWNALQASRVAGLGKGTRRTIKVRGPKSLDSTDTWYTIPATGNANSYLNGVGAFLPYRASIFFVFGTYRF